MPRTIKNQENVTANGNIILILFTHRDFLLPPFEFPSTKFDKQIKGRNK